MPGTNGGTGYPNWLRCWACRRAASRYIHGEGLRGNLLVATGRTKPMRHRGCRQTNRKIEYRCLDCGHVGWTQHIDAERLMKRGGFK
jgi:predicted RNA-binding Zn-ribbon protein involved in translation (DUF1610 family)